MWPKIIFITLLLTLSTPVPSYAMHIMEGFLPAKWCLIWYLLAVPFVLLGLRSLQRTVQVNSKTKLLLGLAAAFVFILSALKLPSVTGSCSHPTGVGLGTILFGPLAMSVVGCIVLLFQALLLAHGGITTLGANIFSMGVVGPFVTFVVYRLLKKLCPPWLSIFLAAALGNLMTYCTTSLQLALAFPSTNGGILVSFTKFLSVFALTQIPLAISEGILTILVFRFLATHHRDELQDLSIPVKEGSSWL